MKGYVDAVHATIQTAQGGRLQLKARKAVLESGDWLPVDVIAQLAGLNTQHPSAQANQWEKQGQIFAINHDGVDYFPEYGLDRDAGFRPLKALA